MYKIKPMKRRRVEVYNGERLNKAKGSAAFSNQARFEPKKFIRFVNKNLKQVGEQVNTTGHITERYRGDVIAAFKKQAGSGSYHSVSDTRVFNVNNKVRTRFEVEMALVEAQRQISRAQVRYKNENSFKQQEAKIMRSLRNYLNGKTKTFRGKRFEVESDELEQLEKVQQQHPEVWFADADLRTSDRLFSNALEHAYDSGLIKK